MSKRDPGKGSQRRPGNSEAYAENYERIFGKKEIRPGRRYYRWDSSGRKFVEIDPPKPLPDLRFEDSFVSPVTGELITNKVQLAEHNEQNRVTQVLPGMEQDIESIQKDNMDKAFGKQAKKERIEALKMAVEKHSG